MGSEKAHIAMFPSWGAGHVNPFIEFAKRMAADHSFTVTFITSSFLLPPPQISPLRGLASSGLDIRVIKFPPPAEQEEGGEGNSQSGGGGYLFEMVEKIERSSGEVQEILRTLKEDICAFVTDLLCSVMIEPSQALRIPAYVLLTTSASNLCVMFYHPTLHDRTTLSLCEMDARPIDIPGLPSVPANYFPEPMQKRRNPIIPSLPPPLAPPLQSRGSPDQYFPRSGEWQHWSPGGADAGGSGEGPGDIPSGAAHQGTGFGNGGEQGGVHGVAGQVVFVSFGTVFSPSVEQSRELAVGLEESGERFLWVLRSESESEILPPGYEERVRGRGLLLRELVPQMRVLRHPSIGAFVSHCGWNSALESITCGVPVVTWPLGTEQRTAAYFLEREMGVGIERQWEEGWQVGREEVGREARELNGGEEGRRVRYRTKELKESSRKASAPGGSSSELLSLLAAQWKRPT